MENTNIASPELCNMLSKTTDEISQRDVLEAIMFLNVKFGKIGLGNDNQKRIFKLAVGETYYKIITSNSYGSLVDGTSVYCFVARKDGRNKQLGHYKAGDIFLPASWKAPARVARGNILEKKSWDCFGEYGVQYLT